MRWWLKCGVPVLVLAMAGCSPERPNRDDSRNTGGRPASKESMRVTEGQLEAPGFSLWYREAGRGPMVLLLHGWRRNADHWRNQIQPLARNGWRVVAPDLPGTRNSAFGNEELDRRDSKLHVETLTQLLNHFKANTAHVVGHSWGGVIARKLAVEHPDRVASLVLVDSSVHEGEIDMLERIQCPVLIVWAENDTVAPLKMGESLSQLIPDARMVVIRDVGVDVDPSEDPIPSHCPQLYKAEEFNRHLLEFLGIRR